MRKGSALFWPNVVIDAIHDESGKFIGFAKITRDISERRNAQEALERAHQQLAQAQKMEALGQLTGGVAHDFNNLLMVVSGQAQVLMRRLKDQKEIRSLEAILTAASRGEALTRQLLVFHVGSRRTREPSSSVRQSRRSVTFLPAPLGAKSTFASRSPRTLGPFRSTSPNLSSRWSTLW